VLEGDCLARIAEARALHGPFDLIYVDPPFAAGRERAARRGSGARVDGEHAYRDAFGGLDGFLDMLGPRLGAMRDALSPRGSLWVHLDYRTVHDVKVLLDGLFGRGAFRGEIIWVPGNGGRRRAGPPVTHQTILVYAPADDWLYQAEDPALREAYAATSLRMHFKQVDEAGRRYRERQVGGRTYRYYADRGRRLGSVWSDCPAMRANSPLQGETTGYPTQKPEALLERIVRATTEASSAVLDPMCGSGTTVAVAARLGRRAVGIDLGRLAVETTRARLERLR
jgi:site-specific DNA-methyltransferase (adenine-specific)